MRGMDAAFDADFRGYIDWSVYLSSFAGGAIDTKGVEDAVIFLLSQKPYIGTGLASLSESDDGLTGWAAVPAAAINDGSANFAPIDTTPGAVRQIKRVDVKKSKRYLRVNVLVGTAVLISCSYVLARRGKVPPDHTVA